MNIICIAIDTLRTDHLSCYGYRRKTSPFLDEYAQEGVLFENFLLVCMVIGFVIYSWFLDTFIYKEKNGEEG